MRIINQNKYNLPSSEWHDSFNLKLKTPKYYILVVRTFNFNKFENCSWQLDSSSFSSLCMGRLETGHLPSVTLASASASGIREWEHLHITPSPHHRIAGEEGSVTQTNYDTRPQRKGNLSTWPFVRGTFHPPVGLQSSCSLPQMLIAQWESLKYLRKERAFWQREMFKLCHPTRPRGSLASCNIAYHKPGTRSQEQIGQGRWNGQGDKWTGKLGKWANWQLNRELNSHLNSSLFVYILVHIVVCPSKFNPNKRIHPHSRYWHTTFLSLLLLLLLLLCIHRHGRHFFPSWIHMYSIAGRGSNHW